MIILLTGDNIYEIDRALDQITGAFDGEVERLASDMLEPHALTDIFGGLSLFSANRLVVLRRVSENAAVWEGLADWVEKDSDTTVVLVEPKVDKRTKTYKSLAKHADVRVYTAWGERDQRKAEEWLKEEAKARGFGLEPNAAREIVRRRGVEQYQLLNTLEQLSALGDITFDMVAEHIEATPQENVFELIAAALGGDAQQVRTMIHTLRHSNDPYMTMGLLASQVYALSGLVLSDKPHTEVASELGVSPFVLRNLSSSARAVDRARLRSLVSALAEADVGLKSSSVDPWVQIEVALTNNT